MQNGNLIAILRLEKGLTQQYMANILNISLKTYKLYESNKRPILINTLNKLCNYFNVSLDALLNLTNNLDNEIINSEINYKKLSFHLRCIRKKYHLTQNDIAYYFGISVMSVSRYEMYPKTISISYLCNFAKKFNISIDYLCGKTQKKEIL